MQVVPVLPFGYCCGVLSAISLALKTKKEHPESRVYLLGMLVHNEDAVAMLSRQGLLLLDERQAPLAEQLRGVEPGSIVIFSAHGHPQEWEQIAAKGELSVIDASCRFVKENLFYGKKAAAQGPIIYIGVAGHLEAEAFLANVKEAAFYDIGSGQFDKEKIKGEKPLLIAQTTLSYLEVEEAYREIAKSFPAAKIGKERCHSTSLRQDAIRRLPSDVEQVIVLGSKRSNNSLKLQEIAAKQGFDARLVLDLEELKKIDLSGVSKVALASGASTAQETFRACREYLESL